MSREAVMKLAFIAKAPSDRQDLFRILDLAGRVMDREERPTGSDSAEDWPPNVIPFPGVEKVRG